MFSVKVFKVKILNSYGRVFLCSLLFNSFGVLLGFFLLLIKLLG